MGQETISTVWNLSTTTKCPIKQRQYLALPAPLVDTGEKHICDGLNGTSQSWRKSSWLPNQIKMNALRAIKSEWCSSVQNILLTCCCKYMDYRLWQSNVQSIYNTDQSTDVHYHSNIDNSFSRRTLGHEDVMKWTVMKENYFYLRVLAAVECWDTRE